MVDQGQGDRSATGETGDTRGRNTRIRFLDQLSPEAQKAYHDEQERKKEEKKSKIEEVGESETKIETVAQPSAATLADITSQTVENTQFNRHHQNGEVLWK